MSKPQVSTLKNGLTVITQHVPGEQQVYTNVAVNVGFRHERDDQNHMTHFLEHMAAGENEFLNTQERETYIQNRRGAMNASTNSERTDYWLQFGKEYAEDAVKLLADGFLRPKFDDHNVDMERESVAEEMRSHAHDGNWINRQHMYEASFPGTQLDHAWAKVEDKVLQNHTTQALKDFKAIHYTADNMTLAVVGDVKHEDVIAWAEKHFDGLATTNDTPREAPPAVFRGGIRTHENPEAPEVDAWISFESAGRKDPSDAAADQVLASILGGGASSRFYQALVNDKEVAHSAFATTGLGFKDTGLLTVGVSTTSDQLKDSVDALATEAKKAATSITQEELDKVKNQLIGGTERSVEDIQSIGENLSFTHAVDGKVYDIEEDLAVLKGVTLEQVKARAEKIFQTPPAVAIHGNELDKAPTYEQISAAFGKERHVGEDGLLIQTEQEKAAAVARATAAGKEPVLPAPTTTPDSEQKPAADGTLAAPEVTTLENGLKIITQKSPTKQIYAELRVGAGNRHEKANETALADIACEVSDSASERNSIAQKSEAVANMRGSFWSSASLESTSFSIRAANEFTADALQLLADNVTQPKLDDASIKKQQALVQKGLLSKKLDPQENTRGQIRRVAFPGSQIDKDPIGQTDQVGAHSTDAIKAFREQNYTADNMILSVVGDVDHAEIVKLAKAQFAGVKAHPDQPREGFPAAKYRGGVETKNIVESDQVTLRIAFEGEKRGNDKANATDQLLAGILGGGFSSRLMSSLRSDKGLVYYASSMDGPMKDSGLFTIVTGTNEEKLAKTVDTIAEEVQKFAATVTQEELDAVKNDTLGNYERALASPKTIGASLASKLADGKVWNVEESIQNIKDVTLDEIKARAAEIFASAPSVAAFGKGADKLPPYEEISEKFGKRRSLDASGLAVDTAPANDRSIKGADVSAQPQEKKRAIG